MSIRDRTSGAVALLGGGLGVELWAESSYNSAKAEMASQPRRDSLYDSANTKRHVGEVLAVGGLAAGGAAVWLYLRSGNREPRATTEASLRVVPTGTGLSLSGQFWPSSPSSAAPLAAGPLPLTAPPLRRYPEAG